MNGVYENPTRPQVTQGDAKGTQTPAGVHDERIVATEFEPWLRTRRP